MNKTKLRNRGIAFLLAIAVCFMPLNFSIPKDEALASEETENIRINFVDNTSSKWVSNDNAIIEAVDNTNHHVHYTMKYDGDNCWYAILPHSAYNVTFNRLSSDGSKQWNSWSAGGRGTDNAYYADGAEYGHWDSLKDKTEYFHKGDSIYLDLSDYTNWENADAVMYINCSDVAKSENNNGDITISSADKNYYLPVLVGETIEEHIYKYTFTEDTQGTGVIRFWRGDAGTLWNCSIKMNYSDYAAGNNCVKVTGWNDMGSLCHYEEPVNYEDMADTDRDGIADWAESLLGLSKTSSDSDGDGINDYDEIMVYGMNPLASDTDCNGIPDGDEDTDGDGLYNKEEADLGTSGIYADTDRDNLSDYEEVKKYGTNPLSEDTDGDGVPDGLEVQYGFNPLAAGADFNVHKTADEEDLVKVSVDIELDGEQVESLSVEKNKNENLFPENMPGYLGSAYDFSVDGTFSEATIRFEFDEALLDNEDFDPVIYYYNESQGRLEELETEIKGNEAFAKTTHFSTYILIDRKIYQSEFQWTDVWSDDSYTDVELVLVIDDSGSMISNDSLYQRLSVAATLVENLPEGSKVGVVKFATYVSALTDSLTTDKTAAANYLSKSYFSSYGGTNMYAGINSALTMFESEEDTTLRMMVVLSDGAAWDTEYHSSAIDSANNMGVKIYTVGLGSSTNYFMDYLEPLANNTGGEFYLSSDAGGLESIYSDIGKKIDIVTDSDNDGISDYYEEHMVIFNGVSIVLDKNNPDSDGDGLLDGEEIVLDYAYNADRTKVRVTGIVKSDPLLPDSDGDGLLDNSEIKSIDGREVIAPKDPDPTHYDGVENMWKTYIGSVLKGTVSTEYSSDSGLELLELLPDSVADSIVKLIVKLDGPLTNKEFEYVVNTAALIIRGCYLIGDTVCGLNSAVTGLPELDELIGAYILNFIKDKDGIAYHSQPDTWQRKFGYNKFYDDVFRTGSKMKTSEAIEFREGKKTYALWMWKGDYYNLHSGAEIGLYKYKDYDKDSKMKLYDAVDFEIKMNLSLFAYKSKSDIRTAFNWFPEEKQWWITGFNTSSEFENPWGSYLISVGKIELTHPLYDSLYDSLEGSEDDFLEYLIFDEDRKTVWVMWDER